MKNRINFHHPPLLSADRESRNSNQQADFSPLKMHSGEQQSISQRACTCTSTAHECAASEPRSCRSPQMICLLRCISRKLCCTSILQHPREPRPLARKCSKSQRATTEEDEHVSSPTKESAGAFNLEAGKKGRKGPRTHTTTFVVSHRQRQQAQWNS